MKLKKPRLTPKKVIDTAKDPKTYWKIFNQLFPLGQGGLRTGYEPPKPDFLSDISVGNDYTSSYPGFQTPIFGEALKELPAYEEPTKDPIRFGLIPQTDPRAWPYPYRDPKRHPTVPWIPGGVPIDVPIPNIGIPNIFPTGVPGGWPEVPVPPDQPEEYEDPQFKTEVYECDDATQMLLGLPPCSQRASLQIQSPKALRLHGQESKTNSKGSIWNHPYQKSTRQQRNNSRHNLIRFRQPSRNRPTRMQRNNGRRTRVHRRYYTWY